MSGFFDYTFKVIKVLIKIGLILFCLGLLVYFSLSWFIGKKPEKTENELKIEDTREQDKAAGEQAEEEYDDAEYRICMNKAYHDYKDSYDEECSKFIMDGNCVLSNEKRYELDGIYMHDKEQCEKLKRQ